MLHRKQLSHNPPLYKQHGLNKKFYSSISSRDFKNYHIPDIVSCKNKIKAIIESSMHKPSSVEGLNEFQKNGYVILKNFFPQERITVINTEVEQMLSNGELKLRYQNRKIMFSHMRVPSVRALGSDPHLIQILEALLDGSVTLYQSINFPYKGSEQRMHSDSVHLTTYPKGGMLGVWIALEKINDDNGPISYLPGSHQLPYLMNDAYDNEGSFLNLGQHDYTAYEEMIQKEMAQQQFEKKIFHANPGDVLIWHANLIHGGEPHKDQNRTRKSLVMHYFKDDCIWYHELSQRPALYPPKME